MRLASREIHQVAKLMLISHFSVQQVYRTDHCHMTFIASLWKQSKSQCVVVRLDLLSLAKKKKKKKKKKVCKETLITSEKLTF
jgi:hypothetical protein